VPIEISWAMILSTLVYKPLDLDAWAKSRNGKKICHFNIFKLFIMQENKWKVGRTLEATLLTPSNIPPLRYGHFIASFQDCHKFVSNMK
jgi:hypothetical protein